MSCILSKAPAATDTTGSQDLGHIDTWTVDDTGLSRLDGDWGLAEGNLRAVGLAVA